jgi:hypothetical protein
MDDHGKDVSRIYVNQLFSLEEIELLKDYLLQERGYDLFILELSLPMKTYFENENGKKQYYQSLYKYAEPDDTIDLIYGESYGLHFPVSGCYTPYHNIPKGELPQEYFYNGITLIRYALMSLNYKKNWDDLKLIDILREIYQRNGLYVNFCQNGIVREKDPVEVT